jgi:hypothetical protein
MRKGGSVFILGVIVGVILLEGEMTPSYGQRLAAPKNNISTIGLKSPGTATSWSLFGTVVPTFMGMAAGEGPGAMMFLMGVTVGPSMGYFYAGRSGRGWAGVGIRFGAMTVSVVGLALNYDDNPGELTPAAIMFLVPFGFLVGDIIHDIASVHKAVEEENRKIVRNGEEKKLSVAPEYFGRQNAIGIKAQLKF